MTSELEAMQQRAAEARKAAGMEICVRCGVTRYLKDLTNHACTKPEECGTTHIHLTGQAAQLVYSVLREERIKFSEREKLTGAEKDQLHRFKLYLEGQMLEHQAD